MAKKTEQKSMIGDHIRKNVIPSGMSVTKAADLLNVSRPTLSNLLNGNASLSPEMAKKLERAFGAKAQELLELQTSLETTLGPPIEGQEGTKIYVPPFLKIVANDIEDWAKHLSARSRLAVLLRILVQSTNTSLTSVDFPGNDDSQRPGWDGHTDADSGTPKVPSGKAGWEFGVNLNPKSKADKDYTKSLKLPKKERLETTFIFVTPRRWSGKEAWQNERRKEGNWKDVRAYDASDIEQWLEQSIPAQTWFANETSVPSEGVLSLDTCWRNWSKCCEPELSPELFDEALTSTALDSVATTLEQNGTFVVTADSRDEGLAFLSVLFAQTHPRISQLRDRVAVFTEPTVLPRLMRKASNVIPVIVSQEIEKEHAVLEGSFPKIVVRPKNIAGSNADVILETLSYDALQSSLSSMNLGKDEADRLAHESGHSLTVLRRRLAKTDAIKTPAWSSDTRYVSSLIPIAMAGSWDSRATDDQEILALMSGAGAYESVERQVLELVDLEDPPVWIVGAFRGVVSKLDALFAISNRISASDLDRFFEIAEFVLSEDDPALDLPEDERWMANVHGKKREVSGTLREGISETLVLMSVYGQDLFGDRLGYNPADKVAQIVRKLLTPTTGRKFEAHSHDLPMYAEAAPEEILKILEDDLDEDESAVFDIIRPMSSSLFGSSPRTGLLWALENLAWHPERLTRVIAILAQLASKRLDDNLMNKPTATLSSIFRSWMPQTAASLSDRIAALDYLVKNYPEVGWSICIEQLEPGSRVGHYSHKPRWRPDARGAGEGITRGEMYEFNRHVLDLVLDWPSHTEQTLGDLVRCLEGMPEEDQKTVWSIVSEWADTADETEKSTLRETIRVTTMTRRAKRERQRDEAQQISEELTKIAGATFESLEPKDLVQRHAWLFLKSWVDESANELEEDNGWEKRDERIAKLRCDAVKDVYVNLSIDGLIDLAAVGEASNTVGWCAAEVISVDDRKSLIDALANRDGFRSAGIERGLAAGLLANLEPSEVRDVITAAFASLDDSQFMTLLTLAPFTKNTWAVASDLDAELAAAYWRAVPVGWGRLSDEERDIAVDKLLKAGRPRATFQMIRFELDKLPSKLLFRILDEVTTSKEDTPVNQLEAHAIKEAFKSLNERAGIAVGEMAALEYRYLPVLEREEGSIPNLEKQIEQNPEMFAQAIAFVFRRSDDQEDPEELRAEDEEVSASRAKHAYGLLDRLRRIPGTKDDGEVDGDRLVAWIKAVRGSLKSLARVEVGESRIGELLAKSSVGKDGVWPCEGVREAMEQVLNKRISEGFRVGKFNLRGVHSRGEGGRQERDLAAQFDVWAKSLNASHPKVARVLRELRDGYLRDGDWEDTEAKIRKRLRH